MLARASRYDSILRTMTDQCHTFSTTVPPPPRRNEVWWFRTGIASGTQQTPAHDTCQSYQFFTVSRIRLNSR